MDQNNQHHNGFGSGFIFGFIVGAAVIFFLFTKRGKQLLKIISEEGLEGIAEFKGLLEMDEEEEDIPSSPPSRTYVRAERTVQEVGKTAKRFFRGVPRKR